MPPAALHQSAKAVACWVNSTSSPGTMVLAASLNTAMLMVLSPTPRTEEAPPGPGSHILPTPGHTPLELDADVAAAAVVDESAMDVPAKITVAIASGSTDFGSLSSPLQIILTPSPCDRIIQPSPQPKRGAAHRIGETEPKCMATDPRPFDHAIQSASSQFRRGDCSVAVGACRGHLVPTRWAKMDAWLTIWSSATAPWSTAPVLAPTGPTWPIAGDRIAAVGRVGERGRREIDADGHVVTPGFIDGHTHMDAQVFWDATGSNSCWHGVTSVVMGNCGFTLAPVRADQRELVVRNLERAEDIDPAALAAGIDWTFETFPEYLDAVDRLAKGINFAANIGHSALRTWAMGERAFEEEATEDDLALMCGQLSDALRAGAIGFSTSRTKHHETSDGRPGGLSAGIVGRGGRAGRRDGRARGRDLRGSRRRHVCARPRRSVPTRSTGWRNWPPPPAYR